MSDTRKYSASFILDVRGCVDTIDAISTRLSGVIVSLGGHVSSTENLGQKNFERVANRKFSNGIYVKIDFEGPPSVPGGIRSKLKLDRTVNRMLIESVN
jgi:small subunit ribosomal protein S6